jgi:hypothetical protein
MSRYMALICFMLIHGSAFGQNTDPMSVLKREVGVWDCDVKFYPDPNGQAVVSKAIENNYMVGNVWLVGDFKGEMAGASFHGSSQMGYDPKKKKYIGSWIDSASPYPTAMEGSYDAASKTLTIIGIGKDPNGAESKMKLVSVFKDEDNRTMTISIAGTGDEWLRMMECEYRRKKDR